MRKYIILLLILMAYCEAKSQLVIYRDFNQEGTSVICAERTIFTGDKIPNGFNNATKSITLKKGFMATLAENEDGTGEGFNYIASVSDLSVNLALVLQNKVSFIRVLPLPNTVVLKKGAGATNNDEVNSLNVSWFYDWGLLDESTSTREFAPMAWGSNGASDASVNNVIAKNSLTHLLAFNEPDNKGQANITTTAAVPLYKNLLRTGYRMGSPATTESQYRVWLSEFTNLANQDKLRIDFVAVHWYDWGNWLTSLNANPNPVDVFNRFKNYVTAVYNLYQKPIWITEFNANVNRTPTVHEGFMKLALPWLEQDPRVERYAYFFGNDVPSRANGVLTTAGQIYNSHISTPAYPENIYDKRPAFSDIVAWDTSTQLNGGETVANFSPTFLDAALTSPSGLTRGSGVSLSGLVTNGYWGASDWSITTAEAGIVNKKFLTFSVKATNEKTVSFASINKFKVRIAANGPINYQFDYQIDGSEFKPVSTITGVTAVTGNYSLGPIDLSKITELQNVPSSKTITFRITPFAASGTGVFYFGAGPTDTEADFSITGSISNLVLATESVINDPPHSSFLVYPTISSNQINVTFDKVSNNAQIKIFTLDGKLVSTHVLSIGTDTKIIETNTLNAGAYILILENKGKAQSKRFVKQ
jgi:Glycosyl hydrolase catalytic core/Secretion system C-terminal sorting domain